MAFAFIVTTILLPSAPNVTQRSSIKDPFKALKHPGLLGVAITSLLYNFGFFTLLAYTPFPLNMGAQQVGLIFFGWGIMLALASVFVAPRLQGLFGTIPAIIFALLGFAAILIFMAIWTDYKWVLIAGVVVAGLFLGVNNTLVTETVMKAAPVERGVASAAYSFVRFSGGAIAPWLAGYLGETINDHIPYWLGAGAVILAAITLIASKRHLSHIDDTEELSLEPDTANTTDEERMAA